ncbi:MAG: hypothetical protein C6W57_12470 [Caldibacillus debilis]|nr:MAG: hypothetical protein C6W57_12470 [Caldibacillus debilis]
MKKRNSRIPSRCGGWPGSPERDFAFAGVPLFAPLTGCEQSRMMPGPPLFPKKRVFLSLKIA